MPRKTEPDALARLEGWLTASNALWRSIRSSALHGGRFWVGLKSGPISYLGEGPTLPAALHAALDQAEGKSKGKVKP